VEGVEKKKRGRHTHMNYKKKQTRGFSPNATQQKKGIVEAPYREKGKATAVKFSQSPEAACHVSKIVLGTRGEKKKEKKKEALYRVPKTGKRKRGKNCLKPVVCKKSPSPQEKGGRKKKKGGNVLPLGKGERDGQKERNFAE